jgi:GR25 family glycosyltransferase involved in LPS biosynthesis
MSQSHRIDKLYIINMAKSTDRREKMVQQLHDANIENYEFFNGIEPTLAELNNYPNFSLNRPSQIRLGQLGCLLSHIEIMKHALSQQYKNIMILEDDACILDNQFLKKTETYMETLQNMGGFDVLYLGANHKKPSLTRMTTEIYKVVTSNCTFSYVISESFMKELVKDYSYKFPFDVHWKKFDKSRVYKNKFYCIIPHLINVYDLVSTINNNQTNYATIIKNSQHILTRNFT